LNLASAIEAAVACGLTVLVAAELSGSIAAALGVSLLFAASYTFWSQAIIAEVYSLHIALIALTLLLLLRWERVPTKGRLFAFFAVFAIGFGNHLSMVLLLPAYTIFLLMTAPRGWRSMFAPSVVLMATACAAAGALQYAWNVRTLWLLPDPPHGIGEALQRFWFDVTKSDWRDTMVLTVPQSRLGDHLAMYWFDLRQQFGVVGPVLAAVGLYGLMAHAVTRRTREIGIRMALGAGSRAVLWMVLRDALLLVAAGAVIGVPAAMAVTRLAASLLYGIEARDPFNAILATMFLAAVAIFASYLPARRASRVDPGTALRYQ